MPFFRFVRVGGFLTSLGKNKKSPLLEAILRKRDEVLTNPRYHSF